MLIFYQELTGKKRDLIDFQLTDDEFAAIGRVTTQWAVLEHNVYADTFKLASSAKIEPPEDALSLSFKRRLRAWRILGEETLVDREERDKHSRLASRIANLEDDRHRITHGLWDWNVDNPERLIASSLRPGLEFEKPFDQQKIIALSENIAEVNCRFIYPKGLESFLEPYVDERGHVAFASTTRPQYRQQSTPIKWNPAATTPQGRKRPPPSSKE